MLKCSCTFQLNFETRPYCPSLAAHALTTAIKHAEHVIKARGTSVQECQHCFVFFVNI